MNTSPSLPHIVRHQSVWYIIPPKDGTVWRKAKKKNTIQKPIYDKKGNVVREVSKQVVKYELEQVKNADGTPKIARMKNYADLPPDAADKVLFGEYRSENPETGEKDYYYHGGDLAPIEDVHEEFAEIVHTVEVKTHALEVKEERLHEKELELERKKAVLADLDKELAAKQASVEAQLAALSKQQKDAERTPDSPTPPQSAKTILRKAPDKAAEPAEPAKGGDTPAG